jgi:sodium-coupled monocarboxylate transporter 8/12
MKINYLELKFKNWFEAFVFGVATVGIAYLCQYLGSSMLQISLSLFGLLGGPLFGVIVLGMFCKFANAKVIELFRILLKTYFAKYQ